MRRGSGDDPARARLLAGPTWSRCEGLITAFELAWRRGETPSLRDYLRADGEAGHALLVELAHVDLEFRLKAGEAAPVEAYLAHFPAPAPAGGPDRVRLPPSELRARARPRGRRGAGLPGDGGHGGPRFAGAGRPAGRAGGAGAPGRPGGAGPGRRPRGRRRPPRRQAGQRHG